MTARRDAAAADTPRDPPPDISQLLDTLGELPEEGRLSLGEIVEHLGVRSFAPVLLMVALLLVSPLSGIPGSPTVAGLLIALIVAQMLAGRDSLWLPRFLTGVRVPARRVRQAVDFLRRPVGVVSPLMRPRLLPLTGRVGGLVVLLTCLAITLTMPAMEFFPFVASIAAFAIACFAVGPMLRDGVMVLVGFGVVGMVAMVLNSVLV